MYVRVLFHVICVWRVDAGFATFLIYMDCILTTVLKNKNQERERETERERGLHLHVSEYVNAQCMQYVYIYVCVCAAYDLFIYVCIYIYAYTRTHIHTADTGLCREKCADPGAGPSRLGVPIKNSVHDDSLR